MNNYLSNKFRWLSVVATFAVVFCHSSTGRWVGKEVSDWQTKLTNVVVPLTEFHVPLFFIISGFMCVHSVRKYGWIKCADLQGVFKKLQSFYVLVETDYEATVRYGMSSISFEDLLPDAGNLVMNSFLFKEHFAYWCYRILK